MTAPIVVGIPSLSFTLGEGWHEGSREAVTGEADVDGAVRATGCWRTSTADAAVTCSELAAPFTAPMMVLAYHHAVLGRSIDLVPDEFIEPQDVAVPGAEFARVIRWTSRRVVGELTGVCRAAYLAVYGSGRHFDVLILQRVESSDGMIDEILDTVALTALPTVQQS
jgi:hypothetical protein